MEEVHSDQEEVAQVVTGEGWTRSKGRFRGERGGFSHKGRFQGGNLTKVPLPRDPEYLVKLKTKTNVIIAIREEISWPTALREIRVSPKSLLRGRSLKTIPTHMEVLKNPN